LSEIIDVIKRVVSKSVFYNSDVYQNATTIKELPVLSKEEVFNHYREILVSDSSVFFTETSGSTGMPLKVAWNKSESYRSLSYLWKLRRKHNIKPKLLPHVSAMMLVIVLPSLPSTTKYNNPFVKF